MHKGMCKTRFQTVSEQMGTYKQNLLILEVTVSERMGTYKQTLLIPDVVGVGTSYVIKNYRKEKNEVG
ncbi:unnamed protein product [Prunus armeniaca]